MGFLEDRARTVHGWYWDVPYLIALGYLGDTRHEKLARHFLNDAETGPTAARVLDRLVHRDAYRKLREMREIRGLGWEDPRRLARLLSEQWGLDVRLPVPLERSYGWAPDYALLRADGFQILDRLALLLGAVPIWRDGLVEFLDAEAAQRVWSERK